MKIAALCLALFSLTLIYSCNNSDSMENRAVGEWNCEIMTKKQTTNFCLDLTKGEGKGVKAAVEVKTSEGITVTAIASGKWKIQNDSLIMDFEQSKADIDLGEYAVMLGIAQAFSKSKFDLSDKVQAFGDSVVKYLSAAKIEKISQDSLILRFHPGVDMTSPEMKKTKPVDNDKNLLKFIREHRESHE